MSELHSPGIADCWVPLKPWYLKTPIEKETAKKLAAERLYQERKRRAAGQ